MRRETCSREAHGAFHERAPIRLGFHFRNYPIPVADVTVRGHGLLDGISQVNLSSFPIHRGATFSQGRRREQEASLQKIYEKSDSRLQVSSDIRITPTSEAILDFSLLAYPDDIVYVNGKPYDVNLKKKE